MAHVADQLTAEVPVVETNEVEKLERRLEREQSLRLAAEQYAEDRMRGRVMSIYTLIWGGVFPIGAFMVGAMSERWGVQRALMTNGTVGLAGVAALLGWWRLRAR